MGLFEGRPFFGCFSRRQARHRRAFPWSILKRFRQSIAQKHPFEGRGGFSAVWRCLARGTEGLRRRPGRRRIHAHRGPVRPLSVLHRFATSATSVPSCLRQLRVPRRRPGISAGLAQRTLDEPGGLSPTPSIRPISPTPPAPSATSAVSAQTIRPIEAARLRREPRTDGLARTDAERDTPPPAEHGGTEHGRDGAPRGHAREGALPRNQTNASAPSRRRVSAPRPNQP